MVAVTSEAYPSLPALEAVTGGNPRSRGSAGRRNWIVQSTDPPQWRTILHVVTVSRPTPLRRRSLPLLLAGVDFRLKIHIRFCRAYA